MKTSPPDANQTGRNILIGAGLFISLLLVQIVAQHFMGRTWICTCGYVKLWENDAFSEGNSQHIADWYTPSHIIHGFLFYALAWLLLRRRSLGIRLGLATLIETAWEIVENTPTLIERYRNVTVSLTYFGDSILNSTVDTIMMAVGFFMAARLPIRVTVLLGVALEILTAVVIRDNLTLNVVMLIWPMDFILKWQSGG